MTTWITILHFGLVVGVQPYAYHAALDSCRDFIQDRSRLGNLIKAMGYRVEGVTLDCVVSGERPKLGESR